MISSRLPKVGEPADARRVFRVVAAHGHADPARETTLAMAIGV
jgi:hypothetical protein